MLLRGNFLLVKEAITGDPKTRLNPLLWGQPVQWDWNLTLEMFFNHKEEFLAWTDKEKYVVSECFPGYSVSFKHFS